MKFDAGGRVFDRANPTACHRNCRDSGCGYDRPNAWTCWMRLQPASASAMSSSLGLSTRSVARFLLGHVSAQTTERYTSAQYVEIVKSETDSIEAPAVHAQAAIASGNKDF
jgi:hypothetical protein